MKSKNYALLIVLLIMVHKLHAQDYVISFAGTGASNAVITVRVENLTQGTNLTMSGSELLHLKNTLTGIEPVSLNAGLQVSFSPNPMTDHSRLQFDLPEDGKTIISLFDISGRNILRVQDNLLKGQHTYMMQSIPNGLFIVRINSGSYSASGRLICTGNQNGNSKIFHENATISRGNAGNSKFQEENVDTKGTKSEIQMQYNAGDRLKLTGISGNYSTVITDVPTESKTITFNYSACTDGDGNNYPVVLIGNQIWMAENLKTTKYNNGTDIPLVTNNTAWYNLGTPGYCWYNNNEAGYKSTYGAIYNWHAVNRGNLCPVGWHAPTDAEWTILTTYLGGETSGGKLKETGTTHWSPNTGATNETGFTALPGGQRGNGGVFFDLGYYGGYWWSATESLSSSYAWYRTIQCRNIYISNLTDRKSYGFSVRCIKGEPGPVGLPEVTTTSVSNVTTTGAISGGTVKSDAGASITARGVCWSTTTNPTTADAKTSDGTGAGSFTSNIEGLSPNTVYYLRAYAINDAGTAYGDQLILKTMTGSVSDIDGNIYYSVAIGTQEWMSENLKTTRYLNGDPIPNITDYTQWDPLTTGARSTNIYVANYAVTYGWFYNWYAVADSRKICPTGWHVPTDAEWTTLISYLEGENVAGGKLKETGTIHWVTPNAGATNETGFRALGGEAYLASPGWMGPGYMGFWWTSSEFDAAEAYNRVMFNTDATVSRVTNAKRSGFTVRCKKD